MEELRNFTLADLYEKCSMDDDKFVGWLQSIGLLHSNRTCVCGAKMRLRGIRANEAYPKWQCPTKKCRKECGFLVGTFFENMHLELKEVTSY